MTSISLVSAVDRLLLLEETAAYAQQALVAAAGQPPRALLEEPDGNDPERDPRSSPRGRKVTSGQIGAAGAGGDAVAVMDMQHGRPSSRH
jgi:hypothetical protein